MPAPLLACLCFGGALLATLALAARATPAAWWRRPNAKALAVLVLGTGIIGSALWWLAQPAGAAPAGASLHAPLPGHSYRVADALNLRASNGVGARRMLVLPRGSKVTATGVRDGDWWQVAAEVEGQRFDGWASSLWLRRLEERP